jgi:hypothetical protein
MQTRRSIRLEAEQAATRATSVAHEVLFSPDLWPQQLWRFLDRESKRSLRGVSRGMRIQVDAAIEVVSSPTAGFTASDLSRALALFPGMRDLTLLNVSSAACMQPLATASLAALTSLTLRQVGGCVHGRAPTPCTPHRCL